MVQCQDYTGNRKPVSQGQPSCPFCSQGPLLWIDGVGPPPQNDDTSLWSERFGKCWPQHQDFSEHAMYKHAVWISKGRERQSRLQPSNSSDHLAEFCLATQRWMKQSLQSFQLCVTFLLVQVDSEKWLREVRGSSEKNPRIPRWTLLVV